MALACGAVPLGRQPMHHHKSGLPPTAPVELGLPVVWLRSALGGFAIFRLVHGEGLGPSSTAAATTRSRADRSRADHDRRRRIWAWPASGALHASRLHIFLAPANVLHGPSPDVAVRAAECARARGGSRPIHGAPDREGLGPIYRRLGRRVVHGAANRTNWLETRVMRH